MKVISKPDITTWTYEFICYTCKSKLQADYTDLKYRIEKKWSSSAYGDGDGSSYDADYFYVICPVCSKETGIIPNAMGVNINYLLQEKVKKDYNEGNKKGRH